MPESCTGIVNLRYQDGSVGSPSNPEKFNSQDFMQLKRLNRRRRSLFVDETFPPNTDSLGELSSLADWQFEEVEWKRPAEIFDGDIHFTFDGASRLDFGQGMVGNCWFLAAIGSLTFQKNLLVQVVPMDQSFDKDYAGIFHFRFWRFGKWVDVVIDDLLPVFYGQLLSVKTKSGNEFWGPLLEKAYAKLCGSYHDMNGGIPSEAFKDFCGGVTMDYQVKAKHDAHHDEELWQFLSRATRCQSLICCGTFSSGGNRIINSVADSGLVYSHAYSITGVTEVNHDGTTSRLVRLLNPWGRQEWNGKWSDNSYMWGRVGAADREKLTKHEDGEFWMELEDFCSNFQMVSICCENPNFMDGDLSCEWKCMVYDGSWVAGRSAGGGPYSKNFLQNPQYRLTVKEPENEDPETFFWEKKVLVSLMHKPSQSRSKARRIAKGVSFYQIPPGTPKGKVDVLQDRYNYPFYPTHTSDYVSYRDMIEMYALEPGEYVVIPYTDRSDISTDFVLTIYTQRQSDVHGHEGDGHSEEEEKPLEKDDLYHLFMRYADQNKVLSSYQLRRLLNENFFDGSETGQFAEFVCSNMIVILNGFSSEVLKFDVFVKLWKKCDIYKSTFRSEASGRGLTGDAVKRLIPSPPIDPGMADMLAFHYSDFNSMLSLDAFVNLMLHLESMYDLV